MRWDDRGMDRLESVFAVAAGVVLGSELARRSGDRVRSAMGDLRWRVDRVRDGAEDLLERIDRDRVGVAAPAVGTSMREAAGTFRARVEAARNNVAAVRARALDLRDRASEAVDRADAALNRLDGAIARARGELLRRRPLARRGAARTSAPRGIGVFTEVPAATPPRAVDLLMRPLAGTVGVDDPISDAAKRLIDAPDAYVVALDGDRIAGIVTSRHLLSAVAARLDATTAAISDVMTSAMTWIPPTAPVDEAAILVKYLHVDELVVAEDGAPVGVVPAADLDR
jgi:CBS domain-containing protein